MIEFVVEWYKNLLEHSDEKDLLIEKISQILENYPNNSCLEIGLGISPYFAKKLSHKFKKYTIIEKRIIEEPLPKRVELINKDWEHAELNQKFDVVIASHVVYYFNNMKQAVQKILDSSNQGGIAIFVVNGKNADYGPIKQEFAKIQGIKYEFTYDKLLKILEKTKYEVISLPTSIKFDSYEDLFETLRISFDEYSEEYEQSKNKIIKYLRKNVEGNKFTINQKLILVKN